MSGSSNSIDKLLYLTDGVENVICLPYSKENMHKMADDLGIKKSWFKNDRFKVTKEFLDENEDALETVLPTTLFRSIRNIS